MTYITKIHIHCVDLPCEEKADGHVHDLRKMHRGKDERKFSNVEYLVRYGDDFDLLDIPRSIW